ncbi:hypothetical protein EDD11_003479 [Mortierella claussenii]|nr:hypothetical protein EDD11_003479 [Mortierella claussenii]
MSAQFSLDALPYVDKQIDEPGVRTMVDKLVAAEMKRMPKPRDPSSLFPDIDLFQSNELMQQELDRVRRGKPMEPKLDLTRYQLEAPTLSSSSSSSSSTSSTTSHPTAASLSSTESGTTSDSGVQLASAQETISNIPSASEELPEGRALWLQALDNAEAQLEHQNQRILNLELVQKFGGNAWNIHNYQMEYDLSLIQKAVDEKKTEVIELNKLRKRDQLEVADSLMRLETKWADMISSTLQVEVASASLEAELAQLKEYEAKLSKELHI